MKNVRVSNELTYVGVFLTFRCPFSCSYCINRFRYLKKRRRELTAKEWITGLNRLLIDRNSMVPITLQGGEPSSHRGFLEIIKNISPHIYIDILTNLQFDIDVFMKEISPERLQRDVPYASIRVSYHTEFSDLDTLIEKITRMQKKGYSVGLFAVDHPETNIMEIRQRAEAAGIDFRTKEFLGMYNGKIYGFYKYPDACTGGKLKEVKCRTTELLIAPDGSIYRCHRDVYYGENPIGHILDENLRIEFPFRYCDKYGECNPCDIKIKNNRFQQFGHCSVEIKTIDGEN